MKYLKHLIVLSVLLLSLFANNNALAQTEPEFNEFNEIETTNEFQEADEFDEFDEFNEFDEFDENSDEFAEYTEGDGIPEDTREISYNRAYWAIVILLFTILAGIMVRYKTTRKLRSVFLLASVVVLGFYRGGPGVISSLQNTYLFFVGMDSNWQAIILFLGLIPITYLFGKVFCGWACYLGALQDFLYLGKFKIFQTEKAQKIMRIIRYVVFVALIIQLSFTHTILWNKIGPFKVAFNLFSANLTGYILLGILLLSSLFIYRPFCKAICPAGLVFGWVTKLPGASVLGITDSCSGCKTCSTSCDINAITRENKTSKLDNQECIMCGDCMSDCNVKSIKPFRKGKSHFGKINLKGIKKTTNNE